MKITPEGIALIKQFESLSLSSYLCPAGIWTIGYGHTGPAVAKGQTILAAEAETMLATDVARFDAFVRLKCPTATSAQHSAMVCLSFNIGTGNFQKSSVLRLHNAGDVTGAARAFALWNKATGADGAKRELRGLTRRRAAEAALYLSDDGHDDDQRTRAADVAPEKPLATSRVMIGSTVGGAATVASGAAQMVGEIEHLKALIAPLMSYLPALQKLFIVLGLLGIGVAMVARWTDRKHGRL
jgi:lysozyme